VRAQAALRTRRRRSYRLSDIRYRGGVDSYLGSLIAQRDMYDAQRGADRHAAWRAPSTVSAVPGARRRLEGIMPNRVSVPGSKFGISIPAPAPYRARNRWRRRTCRRHRRGVQRRRADEYRPPRDSPAAAR
jgi:hypothetical protein